MCDSGVFVEQSVWLRCDLHTHTPASCDTPEMNGISESEWLSAFMKQQIDLVAITDHNSGRWIDQLKRAYSLMRENQSPVFRPLILIPGVEITTADGIHLLALFDPTESTSFVENFLTSIGSPIDTRGESSCSAKTGTLTTIRVIEENGGVAIPAHIDRKRGKGLLDLKPEKLGPILKSSDIRLVESLNDGIYWPSCGQSWTIVSGSDTHTLSSDDPYSRNPGCIYTLLYMRIGNLQNLIQAITHPFGVRRVIPNRYIE
jgi:hypothetical protein